MAEILLLYITYEGLKQAKFARFNVPFSLLYITYEGLKLYLKNYIWLFYYVCCILPMRD